MTDSLRISEGHHHSNFGKREMEKVVTSSLRGENWLHCFFFFLTTNNRLGECAFWIENMLHASGLSEGQGRGERKSPTESLFEGHMCYDCSQVLTNIIQSVEGSKKKRFKRKKRFSFANNDYTKLKR